MVSPKPVQLRRVETNSPAREQRTHCVSVGSRACLVHRARAASGSPHQPLEGLGDGEKLQPSSDRSGLQSSAPSLEILFEDNHLIAVYKKHGVLTQSDRTGHDSLFDQTKRWIKHHAGKRGNVYLGLVHRLDRPVAGIVLFAKTSKAAGRLSKQLRERSVRKLYQAVVRGVPSKQEEELEHFLSSGPSNRVVAHQQKVQESKLARLSYRVLEARKQCALLEVELETGRKHQIRVQLSAIGHPIVGDHKYGDGAVPPSQLARVRGIALAATRLEAAHPVRADEKIVIELPKRLNPLAQVLEQCR
jgi:23S rRNA pseudouridine1911/1915/1917 synthase